MQRQWCASTANKPRLLKEDLTWIPSATEWGKMCIRDSYKGIVRNACPTPGACPFMGTANTMCAMAEVLGFTDVYKRQHQYR